MSKLTPHAYAVAKKQIMSIQINLLNKCTSKCVYCRKYTWPDFTLPLEKIKDVLTYLKTYKGLQTVVFSGGDPVLYKELPNLLAFVKDLGLKVSMITTLLTKNEALLNSIAVYSDRISVSMDAADSESYKKVRGVNGFDLAIENITKVNTIRKSLNKEVIRFSSTISNENVTQMVDIFNIAKATGSTVNFYLVHTHDEYMVKDTSEFLHNANTIAMLDADNLSNCKNLSVTDTNIKSKYCSLCNIHAVIDANGDVYPCCHLLNDNGEYIEQQKYAYGNILNENITEVFDKSQYLKYDISVDCGGCVGRYSHLIDEVNDIISKGVPELWL